MPIATKGSVKAVSTPELKSISSQIILSNTYHLYLRPGPIIIKKAGGLHRFMNWPGPILTDSGGFQIFSLASIRKVNEAGVEFNDEISGKTHKLTPSKAMIMQEILGSDIRMVLDECVGYPVTETKARAAADRTTRWAKQSLKFRNKKQLTFAIIQGATFPALRQRSLNDLTALDFDGFALGGLAVGEPESKMWPIVKKFTPKMPDDKPKYLMGLGKPEQIVKAVKLGLDMFDCVIPTRNARHGTLYIWNNKKMPGKRINLNSEKFYREIKIKNKKYARDTRPIDQQCSCPTCQDYSRLYLRHLFQIGEPLAWRLATLHNLSFYLNLMKEIRYQIKAGWL